MHLTRGQQRGQQANQRRAGARLPPMAAMMCMCAVCCAAAEASSSAQSAHPFHGNSALQAIVIHGGHADEAPRRMKLYVNRDVDFETWDRTHTIDMPDAGSDEAEFPLSLSLFVHSNFGGAVARLQYVGLKGTFLAPKVCSNSPSLSHPSPPPSLPSSPCACAAGQGWRHQERGVRGQAAAAGCVMRRMSVTWQPSRHALLCATRLQITN